MSLGVEVSVRGASVVVVLSGTAGTAALERLRPALVAALAEGQVVVVDARGLSLVEPTGLEPLLSGVALKAGQLHLVGLKGPGCPGDIAGAPLAIHATVEEAIVAIEARANPWAGQP